MILPHVPERVVLLLISGIVGIDTAHFRRNSHIVSIIQTHTISCSPDLLHNTILHGVTNVFSSGLDHSQFP